MPCDLPKVSLRVGDILASTLIYFWHFCSLDSNQLGDDARKAIAKTFFRAAFGSNMDAFVDGSGDLMLEDGKVKSKARLEAVCQIIASNATCSKWTSGKL